MRSASLRILIAWVFLFVCWSGWPVAAVESILHGRVVGVADGDTITVLVDRRPIKVRLVEIDAPEHDQPWGNRSKATLSGLVFGHDVELKVRCLDRYGRSLARVFVGNLDVNAEMARSGAAWAYRQYLTDPSILKLEAAARSARLGLWSLPPSQTVQPSEWRHPAKKAGAGLSRAGPITLLAAPGAKCGTKRYCSQMTSCSEAKFFLQQCGVRSLDGDDDGVPCQVLCAR